MNDKDDDPYVYPGTATLRNKLGIRDREDLEKIERTWTKVQARTVPAVPMTPEGFRQIHWHMFQGIYDWAGEFRKVETSKGEDLFMLSSRLAGGLEHVFENLRKANYLKGTDIGTFVKGAAEAIGDINYAHPFREGNGRTMRVFLKLLARQAGHTIAIEKIDPTQWIDASVKSFRGDNRPLERVIRSTVVGPMRDRGSRSEPARDDDFDREP